MEIDIYDKKFIIKSYDDELTLTIDILRNLLTAFNVEIEEVEDDWRTILATRIQSLENDS